MRSRRRVYSLSRNARPAGVRGFWSGTRGSFKRVTQYKRIPRLGTIKSTYTVPEKKFLDNATINSPVGNTGGLLLLNGLSQGTSSITRIGQQVTWKSFHLKFYLDGRSINSSTPNTYDWTSHVRIMVIWDVQPNGATPIASDVLDNAATSVALVSSLNKANGARFRILFDRRYHVQHTWYTTTPTLTLGQPGSIYDEVYLKMNQITHYANTSTGLVSDIKTGALWLMAISDTATADEQPYFTFYTRLRYTDN